ncbi:hypothetical protein C3F09_07675 [candidate division GN15 bacterium]|uniref:Flagellar hook-associated protein 2 n=1 Tax=candidate division GN15 bacterium TaxID=2072418 RepID=A0A855X4W1_9BACT|nr:MAG: hypothetical protein C3F09_07675 [candidate division GN15 bacterium]
MAGLTSIDGLTSGLNTTEIIDALIKAERQPAVLMENEQTEKTNIVTALKALQAKLFALSTTAGRLANRSAFDSYSVNVSDDSYLTASANGRVATGSYDIQVQSVARNHQIASQGFADQSQAILGTGTITISVGSTSPRTITIDSSNNSLTGIARAINAARIGVTASVVNDGSSSNPYRLILTSTKTGLSSKISFSANLVGQNTLNFATASFDAPEKISFNSASTSSVSLGSTAAFTGNTNKIYTFTVDGSGTYAVGTDNVTLNWSDGTNSGSVIVSQADAEVALVGAGADGLKLSLSSGLLHGGDTFQIGTFAPLLQEASNARITLGSTGGSGSPITVSSDTNSFKNVISGLTIDVAKVTGPGDSVNIRTDVDVSKIKQTINDFITQYNEIIDYIDKQNTYNQETKESGVLFAEYSLQTMQSSMRSIISSRITGIDSEYNQLAMLGIRTGLDGKLTIKDSSRLETAIRTNLDDVVNVFTNSGNTSSDNIRFVSAGTKTKSGTKFNVDITQAATRGTFSGGGIADPSTTPLTLTESNNRLKLSIDGLESNEIVLTARTYATSAELVSEIQSRIDSDTRIGNRGLTVSWESTATGTGRLVFTSSSYGSKSKVNTITSIPNSALVALGLASGVSQNGLDVAGRINGEAATGSGQTLTGNEKNATTDGLKLQILLSPDQVMEGFEGTVTLAKGVAAKLNDSVSSYTATGQGLMDRRIKSYQDQVQNLADRIAEFDTRLAARRESLQKQFYAMEQALSTYNSIGSYLTSQIESVNRNWNYGRNSN